ncbi:MAG: hypothetical protein QXL83_03890 [Zestosphaera sp.]
MFSGSDTGEVLVEVLIDLEDCLLAEALLKSLMPESSLKLRGTSFDVSRVSCTLKLDFRGSEPRALIPPLSNTLRLVSMIIGVLRNLNE